MAPPSNSAERVLILACGALAREIRTVIASNGWHHLDLHCLPAKLHNRPEMIADAAEAELTARGEGYGKVFLAYADCGTGGALAALCDRWGIEMIAGPHCYAFFDGLEQFDTRGEVTSFYLTDFLARQFDAFVWKPLGLDRHPDLREMYFSNYERLVYLAQTDDPALDAAAKQAAERLGLDYVRRFTGYGDLVPELARAAAPS